MSVPARELYVLITLRSLTPMPMSLYMENGDIKEYSSHSELMALHGKYEALYNSRFA